MQMSRKYFWALITGLLFAILLSCEHQATIEDVQKTVMRTSRQAGQPIHSG